MSKVAEWLWGQEGAKARSNVVEAPIHTTVDIPPERVLQRADAADLESVLVIGFKADGALYFECSSPYGSDALWLIENGKKYLLADM